MYTENRARSASVTMRMCKFNFLSYLKSKTNLVTLRKCNSLSKSESVKFSLIKSVICLFTESSVETIFFTFKSVNFHCLISENNIFHS